MGEVCIASDRKNSKQVAVKKDGLDEIAEKGAVIQ